ncbi:LysR family transcriptional regulator [Bdellovibrio sp. HCB337]|uniref:LysR family transcriptional regulator n=1 Tax=Bdellovibrio sp. HCB337 TaxID=3394358 RepID=UPI0039A60981
MALSLLETELQYFLKMKEAKTLLAASDKLGISQPALSRALDRLEDKLGFKLYRRSRTGIELTEQGEELHLRMKSLQDEMTGIFEGIRDHQNEVTGEIKICGHKSVIQDFLLPIIGKLNHEFPKVRFHIETLPSRESLEAVLHRKMDIGIVINPVEYSALIIRQVAHTKGCFYSKTNSPKRVYLNPQMIDLTRLLRVMRKDLLDESSIQFVDDYDLIAELVKAGQGCGLLPNHVGERYKLELFERYASVLGPHYQLKLVGNSHSMSNSKRTVFRKLEQLIKSVQ